MADRSGVELGQRLTLSYWTGRAWPPINFLVYLGLRRLGLAEDAAWLADRSAALVLLEWGRHRHVHENYSSEHGLACDKPNSEPFHSWGALLCLPALLEDGALEWRSAAGPPPRDRPSHAPIE